MRLGDVSRLLDERGIGHTVIGAMALAVHGVVRASDDIDILVTDPRSLDPRTWTTLAEQGIDVEIRRGDSDDPLAGVVRLGKILPHIDVIVGRYAWQSAIIDRSPELSVLGANVRVATAPDVVLLKLYAGGPQDAWDILQLLDAVPGIEADVTRGLVGLPHDATRFWQRILTDRGDG